MVSWKNLQLPESIVPLKFVDRTGKVNDRVSIFHHPKAGPKQYSCGKIVEFHDHKPLVYYTGDTYPGSSGSPVLINGKLYALHRGLEPSGKYGEGIRFSAILSKVSIASIIVLYYSVVSF